MSTSRIARVIGCFGVAALSMEIATARQGNISLASSDSSGTVSASSSKAPRISHDGSTVVFVTTGALVASDTNGIADVYAHDRSTGAIELISVGAAGALADGESRDPAVSADGRFVAFASAANNLVAGGSGWHGVFVRDRVSGSTERANVSSAGVPANGHTFSSLDISHDGRFVTFASVGANLAPNDHNTLPDVFVHDRQTGATECVSVTAAGATGNSTSQSPRISADGRYVVFLSVASNLVPADINGTFDVFRRDRLLGTTELVSVSTAGVQAMAASRLCAISGDGRHVTFENSDPDLTPISFSQTQVFARDMQAGTTELVAVGAGGAGALGSTFGTTISFDGRFVAFYSKAGNLTPGDGSRDVDVFLRDRWLGTTTEISRQRSGAQSSALWHGTPSISGDGTRIAFASLAGDLGPYDDNGVEDIYVWDGAVDAPKSYCTAGVSAAGCTATLYVDANPSLSLGNPCRVIAVGVDAQRSGICFYGVNNVGFTPTPWMGGASFLCARPPLQRTPAQASGGVGACEGELRFDWNAFQASHPTALGAPWALGDVVYFQAWYRSLLGPGGSSLSDAVELTYAP